MAPALSIIVPVYNEAKTLENIMQAIVTACPDSEIIYVNDGSKDNSLTILRARAREQDTVLTKPNGGKGSAIRMGIEHANGTFTVIQDADLEYDPKEINALFAYAQAHPETVVFGSRFLKPNPNLYKRYLLGNKAITMCVNILFGARLTDSYTCYKLFPTDILQSIPLKAHGFELEAELCAYPLMRGIRIHEIAITYKPRSLQEGKKIRFSDAWKGLLRLLKIRVLG